MQERVAGPASHGASPDRDARLNDGDMRVLNAHTWGADFEGNLLNRNRGESSCLASSQMCEPMMGRAGASLASPPDTGGDAQMSPASSTRASRASTPVDSPHSS